MRPEVWLPDGRFVRSTYGRRCYVGEHAEWAVQVLNDCTSRAADAEAKAWKTWIPNLIERLRPEARVMQAVVKQLGVKDAPSALKQIEAMVAERDRLLTQQKENITNA